MAYLAIVLLVSLLIFVGIRANMKISCVCYEDDGVKIPGLLIKRIFQPPLFIPFDTGCGFSEQKIYKDKYHLITLLENEHDE